MARCVIIIEDLERGFINIRGESDPPIVEGQPMTFAQDITIQLMRGFREHFEGDDTPKTPGDN